MNRPLVEVWIERHWPRRQGWRRTLYRKTCKSFLKRALKQLGMEDKEADQWVKQFEKDKTVTELLYHRLDGKSVRLTLSVPDK